MFRQPLRRLLRPSLLPSRVCTFSLTATLPSSARILPPLTRVPATRAFSQSSSSLGNKDRSAFPLDMYDVLSESTLDGILTSMEVIAEERDDTDVEYSAGVLTITTPQGTYVINKQPPNRQIWLSSPISGPKRFDWNHKSMDWVSGRDGDTLSGLLREEIGILYDITVPING